MGGVVEVLLVGGPADGWRLRMELSEARPWVFVAVEGDAVRTTAQHPLTMRPAPMVPWHRYQLDPRREDLRDRPPVAGEVPVFLAVR